MLIDRHGRHVRYLRVSVTDRCNLRCTYCMPPEGIPKLRRQDVLSFDEITSVVRAGARAGIDKIRLTGGEPLVRRGVVELVRMIADIAGIDDLAMTTNGMLLEEHAALLAEAGLVRVNVSLDATNPERFAEITRGGDVRRVLRGIDAARQSGLNPVKINCVVENSIEESDARDVAQYGRATGVEVRFISRMDLARGTFGVVHGGSGGDCARCDRLRLTSDGYIRPCLFSDLRYSVRELGADEAIRLAVGAKPACGTACTTGFIGAIGG